VRRRLTLDFRCFQSCRDFHGTGESLVEVDLSWHLGEGGTLHEHVGWIQIFDLELRVEEVRSVADVAIGVRSGEEDVPGDILMRFKVVEREVADLPGRSERHR
jgi:hypothetical protein